MGLLALPFERIDQYEQIIVQFVFVLQEIEGRLTSLGFTQSNSTIAASAAAIRTVQSQ
jgi:hypothetical protein